MAKTKFTCPAGSHDILTGSCTEVLGSLYWRAIRPSPDPTYVSASLARVHGVHHVTLPRAHDGLEFVVRRSYLHFTSFHKRLLGIGNVT